MVNPYGSLDCRNAVAEIAFGEVEESPLRALFAAIVAALEIKRRVLLFFIAFPEVVLDNRRAPSCRIAVVIGLGGRRVNLAQTARRTHADILFGRGQRFPAPILAAGIGVPHEIHHLVGLGAIAFTIRIGQSRLSPRSRITIVERRIKFHLEGIHLPCNLGRAHTKAIFNSIQEIPLICRAASIMAAPVTVHLVIPGTVAFSHKVRQLRLAPTIRTAVIQGRIRFYQGINFT